MIRPTVWCSHRAERQRRSSPAIRSTPSTRSFLVRCCIKSITGQVTLGKKPNFEFDSRCPGSSYIPQIEAALESMNNSLLQQKDCTWAFLGDERELKEAKRYLFWTSLNTNEVGAGKQIPVLIQTGDGKYYVSETTTGERTKKSEPHKGEKCIAVSEQITSRIEYKKFLKAEAKYSTLEEAYDAYVKALAKDEYKERDS